MAVTSFYSLYFFPLRSQQTHVHVSNIMHAVSCIDPYHEPVIFDSKQDWKGINNAHVIFGIHSIF